MLKYHEDNCLGKKQFIGIANFHSDGRSKESSYSLEFSNPKKESISIDLKIINDSSSLLSYEIDGTVVKSVSLARETENKYIVASEKTAPNFTDNTTYLNYLDVKEELIWSEANEVQFIVNKHSFEGNLFYLNLNSGIFYLYGTTESNRKWFSYIISTKKELSKLENIKLQKIKKKHPQLVNFPSFPPPSPPKSR